MNYQKDFVNKVSNSLEAVLGRFQSMYLRLSLEVLWATKQEQCLEKSSMVLFFLSNKNKHRCFLNK